MRKFIATVLSLILLITTFGSSAVVFAAEKPDDLGEMSVLIEDYSDIHYYQFYNPYKLSTGDDYIAVLDKLQGSSRSELLVFSTSGSLIYKREFDDPRKVVFIGDYCLVLEYSLEFDVSNVYLIDLRSNDPYPKLVLADIVHDIATSNNHVYCLTGSLTKIVKKYALVKPEAEEGKTVNDRDRKLSVDEFFTTGDYFNNVSMISADDDYVYGYETVSGDCAVVSVTRTGYNYVKIANAPKSATEISVKDGNILLLNSEGVFASTRDANSTYKKVLAPEKNVKSSSENVLDPISLAFAQGNNSRVYILDRNNALAVKGFNLSSSALIPSYFMIGSFSADKGAFNTPTEIEYHSGNAYIADYNNERIVVRADGRKYSSFDVKDADGNLLKPLSVSVDLYGDILVATATKVLRYSSSYSLMDEYTLVDGDKFKAISHVYASDVSNETYVVDGNKVAYFDEKTNSFTTVKNEGASCTSFEIDGRFDRAFFVNGRTVTVFDLGDFSKLTSFDVGSNAYYSALDVEVDFEGNLYILVKHPNAYSIYKYAIADDGYELIGTMTIDVEDDLSIDKIAFDVEGEKAYLISKAEHKLLTVSSSGFSRLDVKTVKDVKIPTDILDHKPSSEISVAYVLGDSAILYPLNESDPLFLPEYANTKARRISAGEKLILLGYTDNGMAYVLYNNIAGFIDDGYVSTADQGNDVPYADGMTLHEGAYVYKYPLLSTSDVTPLFSIDRLSKNTPINILNRAADYVSNGIYWYYVSYQNEVGETVYGFIPRYNTVELDLTPEVKVEYGQIEADVLQGYVEVYADKNETLLGKKLFDKTKVKILDKSDDKYYYIEEVRENGDGIVGYVLKEHVTTNAQTQSTMIALYLIIAMIAVVGILFGLKALISRYRRKHIDY